MYAHLSVYDIPILMTLGFTSGFTGTSWFGTAKNGQTYQVTEDGEWLLFGPQRQSGGFGPAARMKHTVFNELFRP